MNTPPINATHRDAPVDDGEKLATLDRGPLKQFRIRLKTFNAHQYIDLREWQRRDNDSAWWPVKGKGVTIRPRDLPSVIEALLKADR